MQNIWGWSCSLYSRIVYCFKDFVFRFTHFWRCVSCSCFTITTRTWNWCQPRVCPSLNQPCPPSFPLQIFVFETPKNTTQQQTQHETVKEKRTHVENHTASSTSFWTPPSSPGKAGKLFSSLKCHEVGQVAVLGRQVWPERSITVTTEVRNNSGRRKQVWKKVPTLGHHSPYRQKKAEVKKINK